MPDEELREIMRIDELAQGLAGAAHDEGRVVLCKRASEASIVGLGESQRTLREVTLVDKSGDNVRILEIAMTAG